MEELGVPAVDPAPPAVPERTLVEIQQENEQLHVAALSKTHAEALEKLERGETSGIVAREATVSPVASRRFCAVCA